jgi:hypothetical protein
VQIYGHKKSKIMTANKDFDLNLELNHGIELHQKGQLEEAKACYEKILLIQPLNFDALHLLGAISSQRKDYQAATELIAKAISINPNNARAHYNLGVAFHGLNQLDAALSSYARALNLQPNYPAAQANRSKALEQLGNFDLLLEDSETNIEFKFDVMFYDSIGMRFNDDIISQQAIGGSEFVLWQLAQEMGRRGLKVLVQLTRHHGTENVYGNVTYRYGSIQIPLDTNHLIHHRYSDLNYESKVTWKTRSFLCSDLWGQHNDFLEHLVIPGNVVCVSQWQASQFPEHWSVTTIANPLPTQVYEPTEISRDPRVFVYASAALKGLASTLKTWQKIRTIYPELQDSRLRVLNPGYDDASALCLPQYDGVEFVGSVPFHQVLKEFRCAAGLFFVNDFPETFCITAALAEATGARVHCWMRNGGAISDTVNSSLVTTSEEAFISDFHKFYKSTSNSGIESPKRYDAATIVDLWLTHFSNFMKVANESLF